MVLNKANVLIEIKHMPLFHIKLLIDNHHLYHLKKFLEKTKFFFFFKKILPSDICVSSLFEISDEIGSDDELHFDILKDCCGINILDVDHIGDDVLK